MTKDGLFTGHPSTFEAEAKARAAAMAEDQATIDKLRAENETLTNNYEDAANHFLELADKYLGLSDRVVCQINRIATLEAALRDVIGMADEIANAPMTADRWADRIEDKARAALQQEGRADD